MVSRSFLSGIIGGVIGFFAGGGPAGAAKGFLFGYQAGALLFPEDLPDAPLLEDKNRISADPGVPLNLLYGVDAVPASTIMYLGAREPRSVEVVVQEGIIGSVGEQTQNVFEYYQTLALHLADCSDGYPIAGVRRIWEDGELVYDARPQLEDESEEAYAARLTSSANYAQHFVLYRGTEDQLPDPTIEAEQGAGNVPAWRGDAYIVYPEWQLDPEQGHRHPVRKFELVSSQSLTERSEEYPEPVDGVFLRPHSVSVAAQHHQQIAECGPLSLRGTLDPDNGLTFSTRVGGAVGCGNAGSFAIDGVLVGAGRSAQITQGATSAHFRPPTGRVPAFGTASIADATPNGLEYVEFRSLGGEWLAPGLDAADYEGRVTVLSGTLPLNNLQDWGSLATAKTWGITYDTSSHADTSVSAVYRVEIRRESDQVVLASAVMQMHLSYSS